MAKGSTGATVIVDKRPSPKPRLVPDRALPPYAYVPGQQPHPIRDPRGHSFGMKPDDPEPPDPNRWRACRTYLYGIDLFNHGYYWEAHEVLEGLWHACHRRGPMGMFFKALIALAAAGLKLRMGNRRGVTGHARRAADLFDKIALEVGCDEAHYMGLDVHALARWASDLAECPSGKGVDRSGVGAVVFDLVLWPEQAAERRSRSRS